MADEIHIATLELRSRIGITPEERAIPQRLTVSLRLEPIVGFSRLHDRLENTVDYFAVCEAVKDLAATGERRLIETLAEEIAATVIGRFRVQSVVVELRKYVLADTEFVAVRCQRER